MFVNKNNWIDIPDVLKVYCGDNWIFDTALARSKKNYIITDLLHHTPYATTTGGIVNDFLQTENCCFFLFLSLECMLIEKFVVCFCC